MREHLSLLKPGRIRSVREWSLDRESRLSGRLEARASLSSHGCRLHCQIPHTHPGSHIAVIRKDLSTYPTYVFGRALFCSGFCASSSCEVQVEFHDPPLLPHGQRVGAGFPPWLCCCLPTSACVVGTSEGASYEGLSVRACASISQL